MLAVRVVILARCPTSTGTFLLRLEGSEDWRGRLDVERQVLIAIDDALGLKGAALKWHAGTPLLGALPELDSMAVVNVISTLEERFGITVFDDDIDGSTFATVGSLTSFVNMKVDA